ncbi:hypothetical protein BHE74_00009011 [Ensete ventricosum]|nr:hypothetical protein BHE74_00009011 [Ensete ventricosum]
MLTVVRDDPVDRHEEETWGREAARRFKGRSSKLSASCFLRPLHRSFLGSHGTYDLRVYTAKHVMEELEKAKQEFLQAHVMVKKSSRVFLPRVLERYAKETCIGCEKLLAWVHEAVVDRKMNEAIHRCVASSGKRKASQIIEWLPYDSRFRYVIATELMENPNGCNISFG